MENGFYFYIKGWNMTAVCGYILTLCDIVTEVYRCEHDIHCGKIISIV